MYFHCNTYKIFIMYIIYKYYKLNCSICNIILHSILLIIFAFKNKIYVLILYIFF